MPDDTPRIANLSLYGDRSITYNQLIADSLSGDYTQSAEMLASQEFQPTLHPRRTDGAGGIRVSLDEGQPGVSTRADNLAAALDAWARWSLTQADIPTGAVWKFAEHQTALAYDMVFNAMTAPQQAMVRKALARTATYYLNRFGGVYYGADWKPESAVSNWTALDSY